MIFFQLPQRRRWVHKLILAYWLHKHERSEEIRCCCEEFCGNGTNLFCLFWREQELGSLGCPGSQCSTTSCHTPTQRDKQKRVSTYSTSTLLDMIREMIGRFSFQSREPLQSWSSPLIYEGQVLKRECGCFTLRPIYELIRVLKQGHTDMPNFCMYA